MIKINLLADRDMARREGLRRLIVIFVASFVATVLLAAVMHGCLARQVRSLDGQIEGIKNELEILQNTIGEVDQFKKQKRVLEEKLAVINILEENKTGPVRILDELSERIPDTIWLDSMRKTGDLIELKGVAMDNESIARFMRALEASPRFKEIDLNITEHYEISGLGLKKFSLSSRTVVPGS